MKLDFFTIFLLVVNCNVCEFVMNDEKKLIDNVLD